MNITGRPRRILVLMVTGAMAIGCAEGPPDGVWVNSEVHLDDDGSPDGNSGNLFVTREVRVRYFISGRYMTPGCSDWIDVEPTDDRVVWRISIDGSPWDLSVKGGHLLLEDDDGFLQVFDKLPLRGRP
jgi:hypothetical protein